MNKTIVVDRTVLGTSTADSSQNPRTNEGSVARTALGMNMDASNPATTSDGAKTALEMSTAVSNQNPTGEELGDNRAIMAAARTTCRARAAMVRIAARVTTVPEDSGKDEAAPAVVSEMTTTTGPTTDPWIGHHR